MFDWQEALIGLRGKMAHRRVVRSLQDLKGTLVVVCVVTIAGVFAALVFNLV